MPELPEVETIARRLRQGEERIPSLVGKTIRGADLMWERTLVTPVRDEFERRIQGQVIEELGRRGKFLLIYLTQDVLLIHLRMSGDLLVEPQTEPYATHHRLVINLDNGFRLAFNDTRKFGRAWLVPDPEEVLRGLGPEPLDETFTPMDLYLDLQARRRQLKPLLIDQSFLAVLGNIYADEALHLARLHPCTPSPKLNAAQAEKLLQSIRQVLQEGIRRNGASIDWVYRGGDFQNYFRVYQQTGQPCTTCGTPIERIIVGQRGTHFCPSCQPAPTQG